MILTAASEIYGRVAAWRRQWYAGSSRQKHLRRPVISIGNLRVGGSGKTPLVAAIAALLQTRGERPDILSRGYGRRSSTDVVVSDGHQILATLEDAGDEPVMLARQLRGVPIVVGTDRHRIGRLSEDRFDSTVHLLDDGFQHLQLARDVDLLALDEHDLSDRVLPAGRLRESLRAAGSADAILSIAPLEAADRLRAATGVTTLFHVSRRLGAPSTFLGAAADVTSGHRVFAVAGIARPERFFADLTSAGWRLAGSLAFPDHHWFDDRDVKRIEQQALAADANIVLTTEKDRIRLERCTVQDVTLAAVPLEVTVESGFGDWLVERLAQGRLQ